MKVDLGPGELLASDSRRWFMGVLAASGALVGLGRAVAADTVHVSRFEDVAIVCSDLTKSADFYRSVLGAAVEKAPTGDYAIVALGDGATRLILMQGVVGEAVGLSRFGLVVQQLNRAAASQIIGSSGGVIVPDADQADRTSLLFKDPDGLQVRLAEPRPAPPRLTSAAAAPLSSANGSGAVSINHVTLTVTDVRRAAEFYKRCFAMWVQSAQADIPVLGLGAKTGPQFPAIALVRAVKPSINHVCLGVRAFDPAQAMLALHRHGITSVERALPNAPLTATVRWRQANTNGGGPGAPLGTPELYFTDPDNTIIQLQDVSYCGGSGPLGNVCAFT